MKTTKTTKTGGREATIANSVLNHRQVGLARYQTKYDAFVEKGHQEALAEFIATMTDLRETIDCLRREAGQNLGVKAAEVHWGHVGDAKRILEQVRETLAIARNENQ